ncbi:MAG: phosphotransferase [Alcanivoracaceae bacterium]|nr:phosphotransferase [Alcanivoracaceae bacterium]
MSVFTPLTDAQIATVLAGAGRQLVSATPAEHGMENSNFLLRAVDADQQPADCVLTVFEATPAALLPWFCQLLDTLAAAGLPVPAPLAVDGERVLTVAGKPALLVPWLPGQHPRTADAPQCRAIGAALATLHNTPFASEHPHQQDATGLQALAPAIAALPRLRLRAADLWQRWQQLSLPRTLIHGDLFRDNSLFQGDTLTGLLDFYAAGHGPALFDLAVCLNDWCMPGGQRDAALEAALLAGYNGQRPLAIDEREHLHTARCVAALRFWLSRLEARQRHRAAGDPDLVLSKDPAECEHWLATLLDSPA